MRNLLTTSNPFADIVLDGSLLLAAPVALLAGLVSFLSPCVLPLVPGYLGYVTGLTGADLREHRRGRVLLGVLLFVLGFSVVFIAIGVLFSQATAWLRFEGALGDPGTGPRSGHYGCCLHGRYSMAAA